MKPPSSACSTASSSSVVRRQPRHHLGRRRTPAPAAPRGRRAARRRRRGPSRRPPSARTSAAGLAPRSRRRAVVGLAPSLSPSAARSPGTACACPPHTCAARRIASTRLTRASPAGAWPSTCSPSRIWASLISQSQPSTCRMKSSNSSSSGLLVEPEVAVHLGGVHQLPDLAADRRQLGRVHRRDVGVLVEQLLEAGDVAVGLRARHRRDQVVDDRGVRAALGLRALAGVVDQERVDQRQVADRGVGGAATPTARRSCRAATPSSRACRGGRRRAAPKPPCSRQPAVGRR